MITKVTLKRPMQFGDLRIATIRTSAGYGITVQAGCVVVRHPRGETKSRPLSEVIEFDGCPAAPPSLKAKPE